MHQPSGRPSMSSASSEAIATTSYGCRFRLAARRTTAAALIVSARGVGVIVFQDTIQGMRLVVATSPTVRDKLKVNFATE